MLFNPEKYFLIFTGEREIVFCLITNAYYGAKYDGNIGEHNRALYILIYINSKPYKSETPVIVPSKYHMNDSLK